MAKEIFFAKNTTTGEYEVDITPTKDTSLQINFGNEHKNNRIGVYRSADGVNFASVVKIPFSEKVFCTGLTGVVAGEKIRITTLSQPSSAYYIE